MTLREKPAHLRDLPREEIIVRLRDGILAARDDVVGIILFGSFARGEAWRDIDVLVVLEQLDAGRQAWADTALALDLAVSLHAIQVVPYSLNAFQRGLRNHSLFVLDVATDGVILCDRANLAALVDKTQRYIRERGIRRTRPGGWRIPVQYRRSTLLSPHSNEDYVRRWLADSRRDLQAAQALREAGLHDRSVYHCQQAVERAVKAVLACFGGFERSLFVSKDLRREVDERGLGEYRETLTQLAEIAGRLDVHVSRSRYIMVDDESEEEIWDPAEHYLDADSSAALANARRSLLVAGEFVEWWFAPDAAGEAPSSGKD